MPLSVRTQHSCQKKDQPRQERFTAAELEVLAEENRHTHSFDFVQQNRICVNMLCGFPFRTGSTQWEEHSVLSLTQRRDGMTCLCLTSLLSNNSHRHVVVVLNVWVCFPNLQAIICFHSIWCGSKSTQQWTSCWGVFLSKLLYHCLVVWFDAHLYLRRRHVLWCVHMLVGSFHMRFSEP